MIVLCLGRRELGKTTLAWWIARHNRGMAIVLDPRGIFPTEDPIFDLPADRSSLWARLDAGDRDIIVQPQDDLHVTSAALAATLREWITTHLDQRFVVIIDECGLVDDKLESWDWLFRIGPRDRVIIVLTAHRPTDLSPFVRSVADRWCVFQTTQPADLDSIAERCGQAFAEKLPALRPHQFYEWNETRQVFAPHTDPTVWRIPLATTVSQPEVRA